MWFPSGWEEMFSAVPGECQEDIRRDFPMEKVTGTGRSCPGRVGIPILEVSKEFLDGLVMRWGLGTSRTRWLFPTCDT